MQISEFCCMSRVPCHLDRKTFRITSSLPNNWNECSLSKVLPKWRKQKPHFFGHYNYRQYMGNPKVKDISREDALNKMLYSGPSIRDCICLGNNPSSKAKVFVFSSSCYILKQNFVNIQNHLSV